MHDDMDELISKYPPGKFNWWAFLFGPFYYAIQGLWGKAIFYFTVIILTLWTYILPILTLIYMGQTFNKEYLEKREKSRRKTGYYQEEDP